MLASGIQQQTDIHQTEWGQKLRHPISPLKNKISDTTVDIIIQMPRQGSTYHRNAAANGTMTTNIVSFHSSHTVSGIPKYVSLRIFPIPLPDTLLFLLGISSRL